MRRPLALVAILALVALLLAGPGSAPLGAQVETPRASPGASVTQKVGTTDVAVTYHRPGVKGREIWGELVPWGEVWRLGSNEATTVSFSDPVTVAGHDVPAGTYALFAIPGESEWTLILNRKAEQWGAYSYKEEEDLLRFTVAPEAAPPTEWLTFTITPTAGDAAEVAMTWKTTRVAFPISVDVPAIVWRDLDAALAAAGPEDSDLYLQAARYARERGERLDEAMAWIEKSIAIRPSWWNHETRANLLFESGRTAEAVAELEKALELSRGKTPAGYQQGLEATLAEYRAALDPAERDPG